MRRRRQKNPLLMRIVVISVAVHIVLLPILAHFGAFKKLQQHFVDAQMVVLPPPEAEKEKPEPKKQVAVKPTPSAKKGPTTARHQQGPKSAAAHPPVQVASGDNNGNGPSIDAGGTGKVGEVPKEATDTKPVTAPEPPVTPPVTPTVTTPVTPPVAPVTPPVAPVVKPQPVITPTPPPHIPVFTEAEPADDHQPQPSIPDDLRADALDKTFVAEFVVGPDGKPTSVTVSQSTGNNELDRIALDAAKQWHFKPATRDGQPVESRVRLHIEFQVS